MKAKPNIPRKPKLSDCLYVIPMDDEKLQFRTSGKVLRMGGKAVSQLLPRLLPLLDGSHEVPDILSELPGFKQESVLTALALLTQKGLVEDAAAVPTSTLSPQEIDRYRSQLTFFSHFSDDRYACLETLKNARVVVCGLGHTGCQASSSLAECGVGEIRVVGGGIVAQQDVGSFYTADMVGKPRCEAVRLKLGEINPYAQVKPFQSTIKSAEDVARVIDGAHLVVVCADTPAISIMRWVNQACLAKGIRWTSVSLNEKEAIVGPSVVPFETACYTCYELRRKANESFYEEYIAFEKYIEKNPDLVRESSVISPLAKMAGNYIAWEAVRILTNSPFPALFGRICTLDFLSLMSDVEEVLKLPYCPTCSQAKPTPRLWLEE